MEYCLIILGKMPGLNEYTAANRNNAHKGARMKKEWQRMIEWQARKQLRNIHIEKPVEMEYYWYEENKRRDHDNVSAFGRKIIQDALVATGVLRNDGWDNIDRFTDVFLLDRKNPRVKVIIRELLRRTGGDL